MSGPASPRVLRVITRLNIGGPAKQALLLTRGLRPDFVTDLVAGVPSPVEGELDDPSVEVTRAPLVRPMRPWTDIKAVVRIRTLLGSRHHQIVHTHMAKAGAVGRLAVMTMKGGRPRTVHTFHGHVLHGYFGAAAEKSFIAIERTLARKTDVLVAISDQIRDALLDLGIGRANQYVVLNLGLDLSEFLGVQGPTGKLRGMLGLPTDTPIVATVGRLTAIKNQGMLLRAMEHLDGVHLVFLGDGELRGQLVAAVQSAGLHDRVHFVGWRSDVADLLADVDVVTLTSRNEGTPVALIEASAAALPVVATDVGGVRHVVRDGENGFLIPFGSEIALTEKLRILLGNEGLRRRMGASGRSLVEVNFSHQRLISDIKALYRELLQGRIR